MPTTVAPPQRALLSLCAVAVLTAIAALDIFTGVSVTVSLFYAVTVAVAAWNLGSGAAGVVLLSASICWSVAGYFDTPSAPLLVHVWNSLARSLLLLLVAIGAQRLGQSRRVQDDHSAPDVVPICSCCKKVEDSHGAWTAVETFLSEEKGVRPKLRICPTCAKQVYIDKVSPQAGDPIVSGH